MKKLDSKIAEIVAKKKARQKLEKDKLLKAKMKTIEDSENEILK